MHAPENTIASVRQAVELGADAVEIDVRSSADGKVMVIHDQTVDRTTNGTGQVAQLTAAQLQQLDAGARFSRDEGASTPFSGKGVKIPLLAEVLEEFSSTPFVIEVKEPGAQSALITLLRDLRAESRVVLGSFDGRCLGEARAMRMPTGATRAELISLYITSPLAANARRFGFEAVFLPRRYFGMTLPFGSLLRALGPASVPLHTWVENDAVVAKKLWQAGVAGIVTDDVAKLRGVL